MSMYQTFAEVYDRFMNEQTEAFAPYVIRLLSDFAAEAPARVLDSGCGTGKTAIALAKNGYRVVGGDISHAMLEKAVQNARAENVSVCFQQMDMTCLDLEWPVVAVVATCDPVNYLSPLQVPLFFTSAYEQLPHNGLLLFDVSTPYHYQEEIGCDSYCQLEEDAAYILQTEADDSVCTMELTLFTQRRGGLYARTTERHTLYLHAMETLERTLYNVGFDLVHVYGFGTKDKPQADCSRWQFVAKKN